LERWSAFGLAWSGQGGEGGESAPGRLTWRCVAKGVAKGSEKREGRERRTGHGRVVGDLLGEEPDLAVVPVSNELLSEETVHWMV